MLGDWFIVNFNWNYYLFDVEDGVVRVCGGLVFG